jgi:putative ABC transport system ATP-binding protein
MPAVMQNPHAALLSCQKIKKNFGSRTLFSDLNLQISSAESLAILGESGSGKSTLLHILAALEAPDEGRVLLSGENPWQMDTARRNRLRRSQIGLVFQAFYLLPHLTARQNIALPWLLDAREPDPQRIDELLDRVELSHRADAKPAQLSGGEQQRVAIARALALKPGIVLADEPTGNLDARHAEQVLDLLISQCSQQGHALVMVTHSQRAAGRLNRRLWLENGCLVEKTCA